MSLHYALLGLLAQEPGSGYDLLRRFDSTLAHVWPATQSQVYTELGKLAAQNLIEVSGTGARNRKEYAITAAGRERLGQWLEHPVVDVSRHATLLQVFLLSETTPARARAYLDEFADLVSAQKGHLEELERSIPWDETPRDTFARRVLDLGIRQSRTELEWLEEIWADLKA